jgi:hypothetical protein
LQRPLFYLTAQALAVSNGFWKGAGARRHKILLLGASSLELSLKADYFPLT